MTEGDSLGVDDGGALGFRVGLPGVTDGGALGLRVGLAEGDSLGVDDGDALGIPVGALVGAEVTGDLVG